MVSRSDFLCTMLGLGTVSPLRLFGHKEKEPELKPEAEPKEVRRLMHIRWDGVNLYWRVAEGIHEEGQEFRALSVTEYNINMARSEMVVNGETRLFDPGEATVMVMVMQMIEQYTIVSTDWWEKGGGIPVPDDKTPARKGPHA